MSTRAALLKDSGSFMTRYFVVGELDLDRQQRETQEVLQSYTTTTTLSRSMP